MTTRSYAAATAVVLSAGAIFGVSPAQATTYDYIGNPLTTTACVVVFEGCSTTSISPVGPLGSITSSVTFDFDTSETSGTFAFNTNGQISAISIAGGQGFAEGSLGRDDLIGYADGPGGISHVIGSVTLVSGAITSWSISGDVDIGVPLVRPHPISMNTSSSGGDSILEEATINFNAANQGVERIDGTNTTPGTWTCVDCTVDPSATPLPAGLPLFATGLGIMSLLGWRRQRSFTAV